MIDTSIQRVEINQVIENQLPEFVQSESPIFLDFSTLPTDKLTDLRFLICPPLPVLFYGLE